MSTTPEDLKALAEAFDQFTRTTRTLEESYRALDRELAYKNQYLNSILESMSDGVIAVDTEGIVTAFNRAGGVTLGYAADEVIGAPFQRVFGRPFAAPAGRKIMELRAKDGRAIPVSEKDSPMTDRAHTRIGAVKVFRDLTEVEELRALVRQKDRLAAVGELAATVAHEIRNPLGGIRGFAELLARDLSQGDPRGRLVDRILEGARELEQVVTELLEYTRPLQLRPRRVACADLVESALGYLPRDKAAIAIENRVDPGIAVIADPDRLRQVCLNILLNAVQSIEGRGVVTVTSSIDPESVVIAFRDDGCGMTEEQIDKVFSPFFTTKEQGTGLGLAIAAKIVEGHGGSLEATSAVGRGSTFVVRLPRAE